jgi:hypothetical protein
MRFIDRMEDNLARFLPAMLGGLAISQYPGAMLTKIDQWVGLGKYLSHIAVYLRYTKSFDERLLQRVVVKARDVGDDDGVLNALLAAASQYETNPGTLIESVFLPAIAYFASKGDARWVEIAWFTWRESSILKCLDANQAKTLLEALIAYPQIAGSAERIVAALAVRWPEEVIHFFGQRQSFLNACNPPGRYYALPLDVDQLRTPLSAAPDLLIGEARQWFDKDPQYF